MIKKRVLGLAASAVLVLGGIYLFLHDPGGVTVTWETASEVDTMGFNLYRAEGSAEGTFEQVNAELIVAKGDPLTGAEYQIEDEGVTPGRTYFYQIEEVEWSGARQRHPEVVRAQAGIAPFWLAAEGAVLVLVGCGLIYWQLRRAHRPDQGPEQVHDWQADRRTRAQDR